MGKRLITQRRGRGTFSFRAPSHRFKAETRYRKYDEKEAGKLQAEVTSFVDDPARNAILAVLCFETGEELFVPAAEGMLIGNVIEEGSQAEAGIGNVLPLAQIPEGFPIFNLEVTPGDGGKLIKSSGECGFVVSKEEAKVLVKLPSRKMKYFNAKCRATIGCVAGGGRTEKPMLKAGVGHYKNLARGHWYPTVRGVHMNACEHPYGGKQHHGAVMSKKYGASPGQHVGLCGARRAGRKKR